ncbi:MAG: hypothetical protein AAGB32_00750 [Pseudomonadota bacterium]
MSDKFTLDEKFFSSLEKIGISPPTQSTLGREYLEMGVPCKVTDNKGNIYPKALISFQHNFDLRWRETEKTRFASEISKIEISPYAASQDVRLRASDTYDDEKNPGTYTFYTKDGQYFETSSQFNLLDNRGLKGSDVILEEPSFLKERFQFEYQPKDDAERFYANWDNRFYDFVLLKNDYSKNLLQVKYKHLNYLFKEFHILNCIIFTPDLNILDDQITKLKLNKVYFNFKVGGFYGVAGLHDEDLEKFENFDFKKDIGIVNIDPSARDESLGFFFPRGFNNKGVFLISPVEKSYRVHMKTKHYYTNLYDD